MPKLDRLLKPISEIYTHRLRERGATSGGVFWSSPEEQSLRYEVLAGIIAEQDLNGGIEINDLGCGYGAFFSQFKDEPFMQGSHFYGYDITPSMIKKARDLHTDPRAAFSLSPVATREADYSVVSGTYNMCLDATDKEWADYVMDSIDALWSMSRKGLAFNMLDGSKRSRVDDIFYADPREFLDFAKEMTPHVTFIDDYPLAEWTIYMKRS